MEKTQNILNFSNMSDTSYGEMIKKFRINAGYSLDEFAKIIGKSKRTLQNYEAGKTTVPHTLRNVIEEKLRFRIMDIAPHYPDIGQTSDEVFVEYVRLSGIAVIEQLESGLYFVQRPSERKYRLLTEDEYYTLIQQVGNFITKLIEMYPLLPEGDGEIIDPHKYKGNNVWEDDDEDK